MCNRAAADGGSPGGCSSVVEHLVVVQEVAGSNPVTHPSTLAHAGMELGHRRGEAAKRAPALC